jgi:LuxR family maltose regulon positive regulatory protein
MGKALSLAAHKGFIRIFVDEGPPVARLLYESLSREMASDYVQQLLAVFPIDEDKPEKPATQQTPGGEWVEPLSDRELDVLQLMAEGLTNPEIGTRLYLSPHTVKAHARSIYGKLGVNNRTQASAKAKALGLLPSP